MKGQILSRIQNYQTITNHVPKTKQRQIKLQPRNIHINCNNKNLINNQHQQTSSIEKHIQRCKNKLKYESKSLQQFQESAQAEQDNEKANIQNDHTHKNNQHSNIDCQDDRYHTNNSPTLLSFHHTIHTNKNTQIKINPLGESKSLKRIFQPNNHRRHVNKSSFDHIKRTINFEKLQQLDKAAIQSTDKLIPKNNNNKLQRISYLLPKKLSNGLPDGNCLLNTLDQLNNNNDEQYQSNENIGYRLNTINYTANNMDRFQMNIRSQKSITSPPAYKKTGNRSLWQIQSSKDLGEYHQKNSRKVVMRLFDKNSVNIKSNNNSSKNLKLNQDNSVNVNISNCASPMQAIHQHNDGTQVSNYKQISETRSQKCIKLVKISPEKLVNIRKLEATEQSSHMDRLIQPVNHRYTNGLNIKNRKYNNALMKTTTTLFRDKKYLPYFEVAKKRDNNHKNQISNSDSTKKLFSKKTDYENSLKNFNIATVEQPQYQPKNCYCIQEQLSKDSTYSNIKMLRRQQRKSTRKSSNNNEQKQYKCLTNENIRNCNIEHVKTPSLNIQEQCCDVSIRQQSSGQQCSYKQDVSIQLSHTIIQQPNNLSEQQNLEQQMESGQLECILDLCTVSRIQEATIENDSSFLGDSQKMMVEQIKNKQRAHHDKIHKRNKKMWSQLPEDFMGT